MRTLTYRLTRWQRIRQCVLDLLWPALLTVASSAAFVASRRSYPDLTIAAGATLAGVALYCLARLLAVHEDEVRDRRPAKLVLGAGRLCVERADGTDVALDTTSFRGFRRQQNPLGLRCRVRLLPQSAGFRQWLSRPRIDRTELPLAGLEDDQELLAWLRLELATLGDRPLVLALRLLALALWLGTLAAITALVLLGVAQLPDVQLLGVRLQHVALVGLLPLAVFAPPAIVDTDHRLLELQYPVQQPALNVTTRDFATVRRAGHAACGHLPEQAEAGSHEPRPPHEWLVDSADRR